MSRSVDDRVGSSCKGERPLHQGFTSFYGSLGSMVGYLDRSRFGEADWHRGESRITEEGYTTERLAGFRRERVRATARFRGRG